MIDTDWQDEEWRGDTIDHEVRAWFRDRLEVDLDIIVRVFNVPESRQDRLYVHWDKVIDWFTARAERFIEWQVVERYRGPGWSAGSWVLHRTRVWMHLDEAMGANMCPDLDSWLRADLEGTLDWSPSESSAWSLVKGKARERYRTHTRRVMRQSPIVCRDCGQEFRPDRVKGVRCKDCRDKARAAKAQ